MATAARSSFLRSLSNSELFLNDLRVCFYQIPVGAVLETTYYRYLYFQEDGRVLYALTATHPHEMLVRIVKTCLAGEEDRAIVWGTYEVRKSMVSVTAKQPWQHVLLELTIQVENQIHGRYGYLSFDRHLSSSNGKFDDYSTVVEYEVPGEPFRFLKDKRL
jgi:F-box protein 9